MQPQGFGIHLTLDLTECNKHRLKDLGSIFDLLDTLPDLLGMTKVAPPYVFKYSGKVPEDKGITGFVVIAESHVSIHTFQEKDHAFVDVFSCKGFNCEKALGYIIDRLEARKVSATIVVRGKDFPR